MEGPTVAPHCLTGHHLSAVLLAVVSPFALQEPLSIFCHEFILSWPSIFHQITLLNPPFSGTL